MEPLYSFIRLLNRDSHSKRGGFSVIYLKLSEKRKKYYLVISERNKHTYGAFEFTPEGYSEAQRYIRKISKTNKNEIFTIEEK